jgi:hypothetical protein
MSHRTLFPFFVLFFFFFSPYLPASNFLPAFPQSYRKEIEATCATKCPELSGKIVCVVDRKVLRQAPSSQTFLL